MRGSGTSNPAQLWKWLQGSGQHRGTLIGGCLEAVDWLRGTPIWPAQSVWRDSILFLETSEDQPSPTLVTYMLRSLADILLGVLTELNLSSLPVITRMDFGHTDPKFILPMGVAAEIDCDSQQIRLLEPATITFE
jgi:muramoyltetrapeptide carboxypeptidase LdcA involved in peptidoglycan recycling